MIELDVLLVLLERNRARGRGRDIGERTGIRQTRRTARWSQSRDGFQQQEPLGGEDRSRRDGGPTHHEKRENSGDSERQLSGHVQKDERQQEQQVTRQQQKDLGENSGLHGDQRNPEKSGTSVKNHDDVAWGEENGG
ncbi:hypothetical protein MMC28_002864 [Mycoblastus sanguinarius]|nr:hypothetical protein [Mycoblastus sanguinarius]